MSKCVCLGLLSCAVMAMLLLASVAPVLTLVQNLTQSGASLPPLNQHAVDRHGWEAVCSWNYVACTEDRDDYTWDCPDGRTRIVVPGEDAGTWHVVVLEAVTEDLVTTFPSNSLRYLVDNIGDVCINRGGASNIQNPW